MDYIYQTNGTCASEIRFRLDGDTVFDVEFVGGCPGNTKAVAVLVDGMKVADVSRLLKGIKCVGKDTSCVGQLVYTLEEAVKKEAE